MVEIKTSAELELMREAGKIVAQTLIAVCEQAAPGISLAELDLLAADTIAVAGAKPSFLGYHPHSYLNNKFQLFN